VTTFYLHEIDDPAMEEVGSFEAEAPPPVGAVIAVADATETPVRYTVCDYTYRVQGGKLRGVSVGCVVTL
jgi:hypothetical protein